MTCENAAKGASRNTASTRLMSATSSLRLRIEDAAPGERRRRKIDPHARRERAGEQQPVLDRLADAAFITAQLHEGAPGHHEHVVAEAILERGQDRARTQRRRADLPVPVWRGRPRSPELEG